MSTQESKGRPTPKRKEAESKRKVSSLAPIVTKHKPEKIVLLSVLPICVGMNQRCQHEIVDLLVDSFVTTWIRVAQLVSIFFQQSLLY
jgi:hypothetical protein